MASMDSNNQVIIKGVILEDFTEKIEPYGTYYVSKVAVTRLSGEKDEIIVNFPRFMIENKCVGDEIAVLGQFRSKNIMVDNKSKLELMVYALSELTPSSVSEKSSNVVMLSGFICKNPVIRTTPFGREIADILLAVNRGHKKSDYLPLIAWSTNARIASNLSVGDQIMVIGRLQSRKYNKKLESGEVVEKTAYEVSVTKLDAFENSKSTNRIKDYFQNLLENVHVSYAI